MSNLNLSAMFRTTCPVDAALIYKTMYAASKDGVLCLEDIAYDDGVEITYRLRMKQNWGMEDDAVVYQKITGGDIDEFAPFAEECFTRRARIAKLTEVGAPKFVIENERFFFSVAKILNCYVEKILWGGCMDKLEFNIASTGVAEILVNGIDLVDSVNEQLGYHRHGHVEPRTLYYDLKCAEADRKYRYDAELGNCLECNVIGCDPLFCYVYKNKTRVKWFVGNSDEPQMLEFTFDRDDYETAIQSLRRLGLEYGRETNTENIARDVRLYYRCEQFASLADFLYMRGYSDEAIQKVLLQ